jgi:EpsI family protein
MDKIRTSRLLALIAAMLILGAYTFKLRHRHHSDTVMPDLSSIPEKAGDFSSRDEMIPPGSLATLGADTTLARRYVSPSGMVIELFIGYFSHQQQNSQIHSPKHCYPGSGWDIAKEGKVRISLSGKEAMVKQLVISYGDERQMVIYWFEMGGKVIPDEFALKYNQMKNAILSRTQSAAFVRFSAQIAEGGEKQTEREMAGFIKELSGGINTALSGCKTPEGKQDR